MFLAKNDQNLKVFGLKWQFCQKSQNFLVKNDQNLKIFGIGNTLQ